VRSEPSDPKLLRNLVPAALLVAAVAVGVFLVLSRGGSDRAPPDHGAGGRKDGADSEFPAWFTPGSRDAVETLRTELGRSADALRRLHADLPEDRGNRAVFYRTIQPELLLAVRTGDAECGALALGLLAAGLSSGPEDPADRVIRSPGFGAIHRLCLASETPALRAAAAAYLARLGTPASRADLIPLLDDADAVVRIEAVSAYAELADRGGAARLCDLFRIESDENVRTAVLAALGSSRALRTAGTHELEVAVLAEGTNTERMQALGSIAVYRDHAPREELRPLLGDPSKAIRELALRTVLALRSAVFAEDVRARVGAEKDEAVRELARTVLRALE